MGAGGKATIVAGLNEGGRRWHCTALHCTAMIEKGTKMAQSENVFAALWLPIHLVDGRTDATNMASLVSRFDEDATRAYAVSSH